MCPPAQPEIAWRVEKDASLWRLLVDTEARPEIEICEHSVRVELPGVAKTMELPVPEEARPVDLASAKCTYSRKRRQIVVEWPAPAALAEPAVPASVAKAEVRVEAAAEQHAESAAEQHAEPAAQQLEPSVETAAEAVPATEAAEPPALATKEPAAEASPAEPAAEEAEPAASEAAAPEAAEAAAELAAPADEEDAEPAVDAEEWKSRGNAAVSSGDHEAAAELYSKGLKVDPKHAILLSNRALCFHRLGRLEEALADATACASLRPDFWKGYQRAALVLRDLGRPVEALEMLRKAGKHEEIEKLSAELRPEAEVAEAARIAGLGGAERKKEEGNALFKKGLFEQALAVYTEALALCGDQPAGDPALSIRNNRAACHHQLSDFSAVVADASVVLEHQPDNLKALMRRMLALEPLEKHEQALEDARSVLRHCPGHDVANKVQHRLSKLVRDRQREQRGGA